MLEEEVPPTRPVSTAIIPRQVSSSNHPSMDLTSKPGAAPKRYKISSFKELDISGSMDDEDIAPTQRRIQVQRPFDVLESPNSEEDYSGDESDTIFEDTQPSSSFSEKWISPSSHNTHHRVYRLFPLTILVAILLMVIHSSPLVGEAGDTILGVEGGVIRTPSDNMKTGIVQRDNSPASVCTRFSHQSAVVNGTIYVYGGRATQTSGQGSNTWNNDFLSLDLTKTWQISSPTINGLPQPSGPPAVANGYLFNSLSSLFLYGGEYSDTPATSPSPYAMWEYDIPSSSWKEHTNPQTSGGTNSDGGNQPVQAAAEGAGISVPSLGRGWYFGGHLDHFTTAGWQVSIQRIYIKSLIEFTFPGYTNNDVQSLSGGKTAGSDGAWRNITQGGLQDTSGFPERADGVLVYVPGYGSQGIILGLAGGTNLTFTQMNVIDVYDVASSKWYKQATNGTAPNIRVNPCAVAASAADGSSTNVYMFGGQNLQPYKAQTQYDDMWILTIPAFTWIKVDTTGQSVPYARAGHSCHIWDSQMIIIGGFVGDQISCDSPGIYVFDTSQLKFQNSFTSLSGGNDLNQQGSQTQNSSGLSGSYGYQVPAAVQSIIGGAATGGATVTAPAVSATDGPLATGKPITYTVTGANGATVTETATVVSGGPGGTSQTSSSGPNIAAIVAGVVAGVLFIVALYLGFCAWVYRRQLQLYKNHVAMSQRAAAAGGPGEKSAFLFGRHSEGSSGGRGIYSTDQSSGPSGSGTRSSAPANGGEILPLPTGIQPPVGGNSTANSSTEDLMTGQEPSFVGVLLNPRRSLRVINRD